MRFMLVTHCITPSRLDGRPEIAAMHPSDTQIEIDETSDWRDWLAFFGYAFGTAVLISVLLVSVVLVLSTPATADDVAGTPRTTLVPSAGAPAVAPMLPLAAGSDAVKAADPLSPSATH